MKIFQRFDSNIFYSSPDSCEAKSYIQSEGINRILKCRKEFNFSGRVLIIHFESVCSMEKYAGKKLPGWIIATHSENNILILDYDKWKSFEIPEWQVVVHEFVHIAVKSICQDVCPLWINEGLAMYYARQLEQMMAFKNMDLKKNIYDYNYDDKNYYISCAKVFETIIMLYGEKRVIRKIVSIKDFERDSIFGRENIERILKKFFSFEQSTQLGKGL